MNQTLTTIAENYTFESVTAITTNPIFIISMLIVWITPVILYIIVGAVSRGKSQSGQVLSKPMIAYPNFWYAFIIWFFFQLALILLFIIFPFWLNYIPS